jgi:hypothetical protein
MHLIWSSHVTCGCPGHYVPQLAAAILEGNKISSNKKINLQGMAVRVFCVSAIVISIVRSAAILVATQLCAQSHVLILGVCRSAMHGQMQI